MPATVNQNTLVRTSVGNKFRITGTLAFTTYETGGPAIQANQLGLDQIEWFELENQGGYIWDPAISTNQGTVNLKGYSGGSASSTITPVQTEIIAVAANTGTLANIPSIVQNVYVAVGGVTGAFLIVPNTIAPASGEVSINLTTGVLTFNAADAVTVAAASYLTRTVTGGAGATEIPNGTNLASLGNIPFECTGI